MEEGFIRFLLTQREPMRFDPRLFGERAATFALACKDRLEKSGVTRESRFAEADLFDVKAFLPAGYRQLARELRSVIDTPKTMAICGSVGTGKTHIAIGLVKLFCNCGRSARYIRLHQLFDTCDNAPFEKKDALKESYRRLDLLVLDEIQLRSTDRKNYDNETATLIDRRYADGRSTLLLSNLTPDALKDDLGISVWRRIVESAGLPIECNWPRIDDLFAKETAKTRGKFSQI
jgi:DNA replication protein DnaC